MTKATCYLSVFYASYGVIYKIQVLMKLVRFQDVFGCDIMLDNIRGKRIQWGILVILTFGLLLVPVIPISASNEASTTAPTVLASPTQPNFSNSELVDYYNEHGQIWINPEGWIDSEVRMEGSDIRIGDYDLNQLPESMKSLFEWAQFRFWQTGDPNDMNGYININLRTNNLSEAETYGQIILELLNRYTIVTWEHTGTWGWDEYRGNQWVQITTVEYRAHINWPWFMGVINDSIPRGYGGLAETVDLSDASELWFWGWPGHIGNEIWHGIGARWGSEASALTGAFSYSAKELLHVNSLQVASHDDTLGISWYLPNVENLTTTPSSNSTGNYDIYIDHHPNEEEPWNIHHNYDVWMDLSTSVTDFQISFDYTFLPWELQNIEEFTAMVGPYGYLRQEVQFRNHSIADLSGITGIEEVEWIHFWMAPDYELLDWDTFTMEIEFKDSSTTAARNDTALAAKAAYETFLGAGSFLRNNTRIEWRGDTERYIVNYHGDNTTVSKAQMETLLNTSSFYNDSQNLQQAGLNDHQIGISNWTNYWENWNYNDRLGGYLSKSAAIQWNPFEPWLTPSNVSYAKIFTGVNPFNLTTTSLWNWPNISKSPAFDRLQVRLMAPIYTEDDSWDTTTNPDEDNGFGYWIGKWDWMQESSVRIVETVLDVLTEEPWIKDNSGANTSKLEEFELFFNYTFFSDDEDLGAPNSNLGVLNGSQRIMENSPEWDSWKWNDTQQLVVEAWDDPWTGFWGWHHGYYWNGSEWIPRFGISGINNVSIDLYFADLPVHDPSFHTALSTSYTEMNGNNEIWQATWDTTDGFADGEWTIVAETTDPEGRSSTRSSHVTVDNYPDGDSNYAPPNVTVTALAGADAVWDYGGEEAWNVSGRVRVQINVTDDIGVFATVFTADFGGWILDLDYEVYNESPTLFVYEFEWESRNEMEDSMHLITIEAWDVDGHTNTTSFWWLVDNRKVGEPPTLDIIAPSSGENITGLYLLQANVTDDWTLPEDLSVEVGVDAREPLVMTYNASNELFELLWNSSTVVDGSHTLTFKATDWDQNEHTVTETIDIITTNGIEDLAGDPPDWIDFTGTSNDGQLVNHSQQEMVSGDYDSHSGMISFEIFVMDDLGIDSVKIAIYKVPAEAIDPLSQTINDAIVKQNRLGNYPQAMTDEGATTEGYRQYTHEWDSEDEADNLWVVEVTIADIDDPQNLVSVWLPVFTDNFEDQEPEVGVPGFEALGILLGLGVIIALRAWRKNPRV